MPYPCEMDALHGDEPIVAAEHDRDQQARADMLADEPGELPRYDLAMVEMVEMELTVAHDRFSAGKEVDYREFAVGLAVDHYDTVMRALAMYRVALRSAS